MAIALNLPCSFKICLTRIIHFRASNCGVRKFNSLFFPFWNKWHHKYQKERELFQEFELG